MGTITTEVVDTGARRGAHGRRVMAAERRAQLIAQYRASGLTMSAFARREGIKYPTFAGWMAKAQPGAMVKPPIRFAEMRLPLGPTATSAQNDYAVEVRLPDGTVVRGGGGGGVGVRAAELKRCWRFPQRFGSTWRCSRWT